MKNAGFTLIEIMVALAILAIAMTAALTATYSNIRTTATIEDRGIANWIALDTLHKIQLGLIPRQSSQNNPITVLNNPWVWSASVSSLPDQHIMQIDVTITKPGVRNTLAHLEGFSDGT